MPLRDDQSGGDRVEHLALAFGAGLLVNYWLTLTTLPFAVVCATGGALAIIGARRLLHSPSGGSQQAMRRVPPAAVAVALVLLVSYYFQILYEPIAAWDARSVWFFHARAIWIEGALRNSGWTHPSLVFSSPDYPKLIPALAAQLGYVHGYWNEFFPKGSLFLLLVPAVLWIFSFRRRTASFIFIVAAFFLGHVEWLSNGYMDAYLIVYSGLTLLFLGRYLCDGREVDLLSGACCLGIVTCLKNEGLLFAVALTLSLVAVLSFQASTCRARLVTSLRTDPTLGFRLLLFAGPTLTWGVYKVTWGLQNELTKDPADAGSRIMGRLLDGESLIYTLRYMGIDANGLWVPALTVVAALVFVAWQRLRPHPGATTALLTALLHFGGMLTVYLSTPATLYFHLTTSAARTMASTRIALVVALFFLLADLERTRPGRSLSGPDAAHQGRGNGGASS